MPQISGQVIDAQTGKPIARASVEILDYYGGPLGIGTIANDSGEFSMDNDAVGFPNLITFSAVGYSPVTIDPDKLAGNVVLIKMQSTAPALPGITVSASKSKMWWLLLLAIPLLMKNN